MIEADFQREYGLSAFEILDGMSWRRFSALVAGLSSESGFVAVLRKKHDEASTLRGAQVSSWLKTLVSKHEEA